MTTRQNILITGLVVLSVQFANANQFAHHVECEVTNSESKLSFVLKGSGDYGWINQNLGIAQLSLFASSYIDGSLQTIQIIDATTNSRASTYGGIEQSVSFTRNDLGVVVRCKSMKNDWK